MNPDFIYFHYCLIIIIVVTTTIIVIIIITQSSQSIIIGINLLVDKSIKIRKSDFIDIYCIDQSVGIDDTLVSLIDLS